MRQNPQAKDHLWLAILFASINASMLGCMSLFSKLLAHYIGPLEVTFFRNFFSFILLLAWFIAARRLYLMKTERPWAHLFRAAIGTAGIALGMWALSLMPLAETTILFFTSPLFTVLFSMMFLNEKIGPYRLSAVALGFIGVIVVANPFSAHGMHLPLLGILVGLGWGFFSGAVDTCLRWMGTSEKSATTTFYFMLFGSLSTGLHLPFAGLTPQSFPFECILFIIGIGITGLIAQLAKTQSFRYGEATLVAPMVYTMIIWATLFDYLFWGKVPTLNVIAGGMIIISSNLFILYRQVTLTKRELRAIDLPVPPEAV